MVKKHKQTSQISDQELDYPLKIVEMSEFLHSSDRFLWNSVAKSTSQLKLKLNSNNQSCVSTFVDEIDGQSIKVNYRKPIFYKANKW